MTTICICENPSCQKSFKKENSQIKRSKQHFCSHSCNAIYQNSEHPKRTKKLWTCIVCGVRVSFGNVRCATHRMYRPKLVSANDSVKTHYKKRKQQAIEYMGGKCVICGYNKTLRSLCFHHRNPEEKDFGISGGNMSWERMKCELDKCILVCANCHGEIHDGLVDSAGLEPASP